MCWNAEASTMMAAIGFAGAGQQFFAATRKRKPNLLSEFAKDGFLSVHNLRAITLFYFSLMEALQAVNYFYLYKPGPINSLCAFLGFIHISLQPIFIIWYIYSYLPLDKRRFWFKVGTPIAALSAFMFLGRLIINHSLPGCFSHVCHRPSNMKDILLSSATIGCSPNLFRSYVGNWHIAWQWAQNSCSFLGAGYVFTAFILPFFSGAYRVTLYTILVGPVLAFFLTNNPDEWAAIWCLLSIGFLTAAKIPFLTRFLTVKTNNEISNTYS